MPRSHYGVKLLVLTVLTVIMNSDTSSQISFCIEYAVLARKQVGSLSVEARKIRQTQQRTVLKNQKLSHTKTAHLIWRSLDELLKHHTWLRTQTEQRANHSSLLRNYAEHNPFNNVTTIKIISSELVFYILVTQLAKTALRLIQRIMLNTKKGTTVKNSCYTSATLFNPSKKPTERHNLDTCHILHRMETHSTQDAQLHAILTKSTHTDKNNHATHFY